MAGHADPFTAGYRCSVFELLIERAAFPSQRSSTGSTRHPRSRLPPDQAARRVATGHARLRRRG